MAEFDTIVVVDWSAASVPRQGRDSIWVGVWRGGGFAAENPATRAEAMACLRTLMAAEARAGRRVLAGFDFAFGYPAGLARAMGVADWRGVWAWLADHLAEGPRNANDRFALGGRINRRFFDGQGPFWGNGLKADVPGLPRLKPGGWGTRLPANRRACDSLARGAQEVWKLSGAGSVGGQALTGIAALELLRHAVGASVWPFEAPGRGPVLAEVFPSLWPLLPESGEARDRAQVRSATYGLAAMDAGDALAAALSARARMGSEVLEHEAWMLGLRFEGIVRRETAPRRQD